MKKIACLLCVFSLLTPSLAVGALSVTNPEDAVIYSPNSAITIVANDTEDETEYLFQLAHEEELEGGMKAYGIYYEATDEEQNQTDTHISHACSPQLGATEWPEGDHELARVKKLPSGSWVKQDGYFQIIEPE